MNDIIFKNVYKEYPTSEQPVLSDVSLTLTEGSFSVLVGESGSGKSTILKIIAGLLTETSGSVESTSSISMAFQSGALFPWLTVYENVALPLRSQKDTETSIKKKSLEALIEMGLTEYRDKLPKELSGGQRQRVGIARALATDSQTILLDEPFSALDIKTTKELHSDLIALWQKTGKTIVMVSHSIEEAVALAQHIYLMDEGKLVKTFDIDMAYPRDESSTDLLLKVQEIRKVFLG